MAERRMFAKSVINSARFLTMPPSSRLLYYDLGMAADDDGVVEAFRAYCTERKNTVDAERFFDFYSANGWKQGRGKPIVDWKAAVRTWERQSNAGQDESSPRQYDAATDTWR